MKMNRPTVCKYTRCILGIVSLLAILSSCSTTRRLPVYEVKPMAPTRIIRNVQQDRPVYKNYESKKVTVEIETQDKQNSFSGQFKMKRDQCIILTLRKISVPLARGKITPDSVMLINYFDKSYYSEELGKLKNILPSGVDFPLVQSLLTGDLAAFLSDVISNKELVSTIDSQQYKIETLLSQRVISAREANNSRRWERYLRTLDENEFITHTFWIDPQFFVIKKMTCQNLKNEETITIEFKEHELIGRSLFPQYIFGEYLSAKTRIRTEISLSKSSINTDKDFSFSIPEKSEKMNVIHLQ